ncbi:MAG: hypothetical protein ABIH23_17470, partial [bacterium]
MDATTRDIKRRIDDLKAAEEMGVGSEEQDHAFALNPTPNLDLISKAAQTLQDPERRLIDEFFWFWPSEWGKGNSDPALSALSNNDRTTAFKVWSDSVSKELGPASIVAKHNLAVMSHLVALDSEHVALKTNSPVEQPGKLRDYWRTSFRWWKELTDDEAFWSLVTERIRMIDDPRLTTGFARRIKATLPESIAKVNAMLAIKFAEQGKSDLATTHITYMKDICQDPENATKILAVATDPLKVRIRTAFESATTATQREPGNGASCVQELLQAVKDPLQIIRLVLPEQDHERIDLCDSVADACLTCLDAFAREAGDWAESLKLLDAAAEIAESSQTKARLDENKSWFLMGPIRKECERAITAVERKPTCAVDEAKRLLSVGPPMLEKLVQFGAPAELCDRAKDELAGTLMQCAVVYSNKTEKWQPCISLLEASLRLVANPQLKERIAKNLQTIRHNDKVYGNLKPISSAPSLSLMNDFGFKLYGASDNDLETGSYMSTFYFVFLYIPIFPIRRYRVIRTGGGYSFLGKAPLRIIEKLYLFISVALIALFIAYIIVLSNTGSTGHSIDSSSQSSTSIRPTVRPAPSPSPRGALAEEIAAGKGRARLIENQIVELDKRLKEYKRIMDSYRLSQMVNEYNRLVPEFNSLV